MWRIKAPITTGSLPNRFVLEPNIPNIAPPEKKMKTDIVKADYKNGNTLPKTSPTPIKIPESPTSCFALSPNDLVKPMQELYTPLKNPSSIPRKKKQIQ